jgi:hypothetical protein
MAKVSLKALAAWEAGAGERMPLGFVDIPTILLVTVGPLQPLTVFATLTANAEPDFRREVANRTVTMWQDCSAARRHHSRHQPQSRPRGKRRLQPVDRCYYPGCSWQAAAAGGRGRVGSPSCACPRAATASPGASS